jgi:hypothetical protein
MTDPHVREVEDEPPPFLGTWTRVYTAVVICLVLLIAFLAWFSGVFRR